MSKMKILTVTTLYPNIIQHRHGIFIENRMRHLLSQYPNIQLKVIAPVPYFPFKHKIFGEYSKLTEVPYKEERFGIEIYHPRYLVIPKVGMHLTPYFLYRSVKKTVKRIIDKGYDFDLIDAHYFYPDGVAATRLANEINKPITVTARGSDITMIPNFPKARQRIQNTLKKISAGIGVCKALVDEMKSLQPDHKPLHTIRNGVDLELFHDKSDRVALRKQLGFKKFTLLMVGNLVELKGHALVIKALTKLPECELVIVGEGDLKQNLIFLANSEGVSERVNFVGGLQQQALPDYYAAADCLMLASSREGWANVLLESMACGTPVIATKVWGTPEVVSQPEAGLLINRSVNEVIQGVETFIMNNIDRSLTRKYAESFSWNESSLALSTLYAELIAMEKHA